MTRGRIVEEGVMKVGGAIKSLEGLSFFPGCVIGINSLKRLLALPSVIGEENLKIN